MKALLGFLGLMLVVSRAMANDVSAYIVNGTNVSSAATYPFLLLACFLLMDPLIVTIVGQLC